MGKLLPGLLGICAIAAAQDGLDLKAYEAFFRQIPQQNAVTSVAANGQLTSLTRLSPQAALGITDKQDEGLNVIAHDLQTKSAGFDDAMKSLVLETRLAAIASEDPSPAVGRRLAETERQRTQMVTEHVEQLRSLLGGSQFQTVDDFINAKKSTESFFPTLVNGRPAIAKAAPARK